MTAVFRPIVLVPVFDHEHAIGAMVEAILRHPWPCLLVDDGSGPACEQVLRQIADAHPGRVLLIRLPENRGKGAAMMAGFEAAAKLGLTHALQIDADGQHNAGDIPRFLALAQEHPAAVIAGCPVYDQSVPRHRFYLRYLTHILVWVNTLSFEIRDSMCGLRVYPLDAVTGLMGAVQLGRHMEFDTEVIVRMYWRGASVVNVPTRVTYPTDGVSHFRLFQDNMLMTGMLTRLFFGMLWRMPRLLWRKVRPA